MRGRRWQARHYASLVNLPRANAETIRAMLMEHRNLHDCELLLPPPPDLPRALQRIRRAITDKERVGIFGDYDCDGITSAAQLARYCERHGIGHDVRLPHRVHDGYGLSARVVDAWIEKGIRLLITVDTGITAIEPIRTLQKRGVDVIVVDHHHCQAELPPAFALLHPTLTPGFPLPHPSGAGMVFLLLQALEGGAWDDMHTDRALAMIGTVADLVELKGINRAFVRQGLLSLESLHTGPLQVLRDSVRGKGALTSIDVAFRIAPRINAAGRMDDPTLALQAILRGGCAIERLHQLNRARQEITQCLVIKALNEAEKTKNTTLMASASEEYPHGIVGLIAGALTENTGRPSIVATIDGAYATASLRSPPCYHVTEGLTRMHHLFESFGGHAQAAGCHFRAEAWGEITARLAEDIAAHVSLHDLVPSIDIDACISPSDISLALVTSLDALQPFGQGNPEPRFLLRGVTAENRRRVGADGAHFQATIAGHKAVGFKMGTLCEALGGPLEIVCRIGRDSWNGRREVQVFVEDARVKNEE